MTPRRAELSFDSLFVAKYGGTHWSVAAMNYLCRRGLSALSILLLCFLAVAQGPEGSINGDGVRLRSGPSTEANIVATLSRGERVMVEKILPGQPWAKIYSSARRDGGWIHTDFLKMDAAPAGTETPEPAFADVVRDLAEARITEHFPEGRAVRLMAEGQTRVYRGVTGINFSEMNECSGSDVPYTRVDLSLGQDLSVDPILAIVGGGALAPLRMAELTDAAAVASLQALADTVTPEEGEPFHADKAKAYEVAVKEGTVRLLLRTQTIAGTEGLSPSQCFVAAADKVARLYTGCGSLPEFFLLGDAMYCVLTHGACESDDYNKSVWRIHATGVERVYHATWFGC